MPIKGKKEKGPTIAVGDLALFGPLISSAKQVHLIKLECVCISSRSHVSPEKAARRAGNAVPRQAVSGIGRGAKGAYCVNVCVRARVSPPILFAGSIRFPAGKSGPLCPFFGFKLVHLVTSTDAYVLCLCLSLCPHIFVCVSLSVSLGPCLCLCLCLSVCLSVCVCVNVYVYVCVCEYTFEHLHIYEYVYICLNRISSIKMYIYQ